MSIFGTNNIRLKFTIDSTDYDKSLVAKDYFYDNKYNKKILKIRRDIRTGNKKQVFKGNEKEFSFTLFNITTADWINTYSKLKNLNNIEYYPHSDNAYFYECYCDKIEFETYGINDIGIVNFVFKTNKYKDTRKPTYIIVDNILVANGILLPGYYLNGVKYE